MTVSTEISREEYTGNGVTTDFDYRFRVFSADELVVSVADTTENISVLTLNTDYTVTGAGSRTGGKVKLTNPLAIDWRISIERDLPVTQETDVRNQGNFFPEVHEDAWDKLTMLIQQVWSYFGLALRKPTWLAKFYDAQGNRIANLGNPINAQDAVTKSYVDNNIDGNIRRAIRVPVGEVVDVLPSRFERVNKLLAFDSSGEPSVMVPIGGSAADVLLQLAASHGGDIVNNVAHYYDFSTDIKNRSIPNTVQFVYTYKYTYSSLSKSSTQLVRDSSEDNIFHSNKDWNEIGVINGKALIFDVNGKAFRLVPINGSVSVESLGGGDGADDSKQLEIAQQVSTKPVVVEENKVYNFTHPIKHTGGRGWKGKNTTFLGPSSGPRCPFISSLKTAQGADNDVVNGTSGVSNATFKGLVIDTNYTDTTGTVSYIFAENTLDNWVKCRFIDVIIKNSKFDNLSLQNVCTDITFHNCRFENAGEDGVTLRKTCESILFENCVVSKTALVAHTGGAKYGDGVVVKAKFVTINNSKFLDVGNSIKGAAIACNAEDNDTPYQASYLIVTNNRFINCYGGLGMGTVNAGMIAAGTLIEGITIDNNEFINTAANAIGLRYLKDVKVTNCNIIGQNLSSYHAVELINVINISGNADVRTAQGGACLINNCTGSFKITGNDVSKAAALNSVVITTCDGMSVDAIITLSGRNCCTIDYFSNGIINVRAKGITLAGVVANTVSRTTIDANLTQVGHNGVSISAGNSLTVHSNTFDVGTSAANTYASLRFVSGSANHVFSKSASGQSNKPVWDVLIESGVSGLVLFSTGSAGTSGKVSIAAGATVNHIVNE